jgi:hypothetical protein
MLFALIGEQFPENLVVGLILSVKHDFNKISVWVNNSDEFEKIEQLKKDIMNILCMLGSS